MPEVTIAHEKKLLNKVMLDSIFCNLPKGDPLHKVILMIVNDIVYRAAVQSRNAETIESLELLLY